VLPDGNYRMTLPAGFVRDEAGNPLGRDVVYEFYVLSGDANGDRRVDFGDLVVLAQNYGGSGRGWAAGDFTGDGMVSFADLVVMAQRYGVTLPAGGGVTGAAGAMPALASVMAGLTAPAATPVGGAGLDEEETGARAAYRPAAVRAAPARAAFGRVRVGGGEVGGGGKRYPSRFCVRPGFVSSLSTPSPACGRFPRQSGVLSIGSIANYREAVGYLEACVTEERFRDVHRVLVVRALSLSAPTQIFVAVRHRQTGG
jgi:hypothetical protein